MSSNLPFPSVGVVEDDKADAQLVKYQIEDFGAKPVVFSLGFRDLDDLLTQVRESGVAGVVCDHRLRVRQYAPFTGAEAVEHLVLSKIPAVLVSSYGKIDLDTDIRPHQNRTIKRTANKWKFLLFKLIEATHELFKDS
jgi:CheY-like chemotaxis protein